MPSKWGEHVTIVRREQADPLTILRFEGWEIEFEYDGTIRGNDKHYWLDVYSNRLLALREFLGLRREPEFNLHLTFAVAPGEEESKPKRLCKCFGD
jgi:hypothetical protein